MRIKPKFVEILREIQCVNSFHHMRVILHFIQASVCGCECSVEKIGGVPVLLLQEGEENLKILAECRPLYTSWSYCSSCESIVGEGTLHCRTT